MAIVGNNTAGRALPNISFFGSQSWTPSYTLQAYVYVIGGGGSGGCSGEDNRRASGGGAGGCALSLLTLVSGTAYTVTIGAGGAQIYNATNNNDHGNAGGNSSFAGSGISTMTGNGGGGGYQNVGAAANGGSGGSASGGTIANFTGGAGGSSGDANNNASGGGAVGLWATGNAAPTGDDDTYEGKLGGNIGFDSDTYASNTLNSYDAIKGLSGIPALPPFNIYNSQVQFSNPTYGTEIVSFSQNYQPAGAVMDHYGYAYSTNYWYPAASPFCGGVGASHPGHDTRAGAGSVGGGGGGVVATGGAYCGAGGNGAVLIFPVDLG